MSANKLLALRNLMKNLPVVGGSVHAYIVPTDDAHQSEYTCAHDDRRAFLSGFDGSAGTAVVTHDSALLWTDGRYYDQAAKQLEEGWTLMKDGLTTTLSIGAWLAKNLPSGAQIGVDPLLMSYRMWNTIETDLAANESKLMSVRANLVDEIWSNQPAVPDKAIIRLEMAYCGQTIKEKLDLVRAQMHEKSTFAMVVSALDEIAWFMNLRGDDIDFNPVFFSYLIITDDDIHLFVNKEKLPADFGEHLRLNEVQVTINNYECVEDIIIKLLAQNPDHKLWISQGSNYLLNSLVPEKKRVQEITAINLMKAIKNPVEAEGMKNCHIRDGKALCQYFAWLENEVKNGRPVDEISGASKLESFRKDLDHFMNLSFATISGFGPNGSIIHYHPKPETNLPITMENLYLCDSGAQFKDGTTDVTRTWHFGTPTQHQKDCFTRVLKGQIQMGTQVFPKKIKGYVLDTLARKFLWDVGLDYGHGTGHGIGHFLNVHEGPMGIGTRVMPDDPGLQENMFLSNEPGYYETDQFGIRIEDIVRIVPAKVDNNFAGREALTFETVTMCPIQTKLINIALLTDVEINHVNDYHAKVYELVAPLLEGDGFTLDWLKKETKAINRF